jgi:hypothetical protein
MTQKYYTFTNDEYQNIRETITTAIEYVGSANYSSRERQAKAAIDRAFRTGKYVDPNDIKVER